VSPKLRTVGKGPGGGGGSIRTASFETERTVSLVLFVSFKSTGRVWRKLSTRSQISAVDGYLCSKDGLVTAAAEGNAF
jgi:hypothetical protein